MPETMETLLESTLESVDNAETMALDAAKGIGMAEEACMDLGLAVREAMVNAVVHGNQYNPDKKVRLILEQKLDSLRITIIDEGGGFDLNKVPDPTEGDNLLRGSGRGLLLIQTFVDEFAVKKAPGGGAEVTLVKYAISD